MSHKAVLICTLISDRRLCVPCLAANTEMQPGAVEGELQMLRRAVVIQRHADKRCDQCGERTTVFMLANP